MTMTKQDFERLSSFIYTELGIKMSASKQTMLTGRLQKRLRALKMRSFGEYCDFLFSKEGQATERIHLFDVVTTNKTDFFREPGHFDFLVQEALPDLISRYQRGLRSRLRVWSAGCSTGEEPYTLTMVLREFSEQQPQPGFRFEILATDISTRVLEIAKHAVYSQDRSEPIPLPLRRKYLLRSKDKTSGLVRIIPDNRKLVSFGRLNFMDEQFGIREPLDIIFCRNVIIYFDSATQEKLINKFCRHLKPGGYLFLGHSESMHGYTVPLIQVAPTVYRKPA